MTVQEVFRRCRCEGIELTASHGKVKFRGSAEKVTPELVALLVENKPALLKFLANCPTCRRSRDAGRCWHCHDRLCEICMTRTTGSAFIATCWTCDFQVTTDESVHC